MPQDVERLKAAFARPGSLAASLAYYRAALATGNCMSALRAGDCRDRRPNGLAPVVAVAVRPTVNEALNPRGLKGRGRNISPTTGTG